MRRQELSPAARRRGDRTKVSRIAALLGALIALTAVYRTQAQHAPDASWINPRASAPRSSELVTPEEDLCLRCVDHRNIGVSKISSAAGSGDTTSTEVGGPAGPGTRTPTASQAATLLRC